MSKGRDSFALELCTLWPPHVTVAAGPWMDEAAAMECAAHVAGLFSAFEVTLGPRVMVDGEGEQRAATYSADQTLRAGWVEATTQGTNEFMRLHSSAMAFLDKESHQFEPHASLHYFQSGELDGAEKARMLDMLRVAWESPLSFVATGVHVTRYLGTTPDEWRAVKFFPFQTSSVGGAHGNME